MSTDVDVVVIGGGPAGAAFATFLARRGYRCAVLERTAFPRYHIGESLVPDTYGTLDRLGLLPDLKAAGFPEKRSVRFVSATGKEAEPFFFSEVLPDERARTWQVERSVFDQMCLDNAQKGGADVRTATAAARVRFEGSRAVGVLAAPNVGEPYEIRARVVADASGAMSVIGRQLGLRIYPETLVKAAIWGYFEGGRRSTGVHVGETIIFMLEDRAWFWYVPLPNNVVSVGLVVSTAFLADAGSDREEILRNAVRQCAPLAARLAGAERVGSVRCVPRLAFMNQQTCGDGWVAIGDARGFLDPIYSSGLLLALGSAERAAESVHQALVVGDVSAAQLGTFEPELQAGVDVISRLIHAFYDPDFSFRRFLERFPNQRTALIDCLVGDVWKDMSSFVGALAQMTPPPPPLPGARETEEVSSAA